MERKKLIGIITSYMTAFIVFVSVLVNSLDNDKEKLQVLEGTLLFNSNDIIMVQDKSNVIYTFNNYNMDVCDKGNILLKYSGILDKNKDVQDVSIIDCTVKEVMNDSSMPFEWNDEGMFSQFYKLAYNKMKSMSLKEKINQMLLVRYPNDGIDVLMKEQFGGYIFFERDFSNKGKMDIQKMINDLQEVSKIPILTAVDEEGGKVVRVSSNPNLIDERFRSPRELYDEGGFELIKKDTIKKSAFLKELGLNLNLAPVVDVVSDKTAYMYERSIQGNTVLTSEYAKTVIGASKNTGVSYVLKHFPGYGNNKDTHMGSVIDNRSYDDIYANDFPPFEEGIKAFAEAILVSHNIVNGIDANNPATLSPTIHNLLRNEFKFTGIIITDDLEMTAINKENDVYTRAILAGNDLIITSNYNKAYNDIKESIDNNIISVDTIDRHVTRLLAWKYYKGLFYEHEK